MLIKYICGFCGSNYELSDNSIGIEITCPKCGSVFIVGDENIIEKENKEVITEEKKQYFKKNDFLKISKYQLIILVLLIIIFIFLLLIIPYIALSFLVLSIFTYFNKSNSHYYILGIILLFIWLPYISNFQDYPDHTFGMINPSQQSIVLFQIIFFIIIFTVLSPFLSKILKESFKYLFYKGYIVFIILLLLINGIILFNYNNTGKYLNYSNEYHDNFNKVYKKGDINICNKYYSQNRIRCKEEFLYLYISENMGSGIYKKINDEVCSTLLNDSRNNKSNNPGCSYLATNALDRYNINNPGEYNIDYNKIFEKGDINICSDYYGNYKLKCIRNFLYLYMLKNMGSGLYEKTINEVCYKLLNDYPNYSCKSMVSSILHNNQEIRR